MKEIEIVRIPGFVTLLNNTGNDDVIANAAMVNKEYNGINVPEKKHFRIMEEMPRAGHWGCLDHAYITLHIETPIFVARQILRASHMAFNELSLRYLEANPKFYIPEVWYTDVKRKELGEDPVPVGEDEEDQLDITQDEINFLELAWKHYLYKLSKGVRKEQARGSLPVGIFTEFWMSGRLSDWLHFLNLRMDQHAQLEIRYIADRIGTVIEQLYPVMWKEWNEYARGPLPSGCIQTP